MPAAAVAVLLLMGVILVFVPILSPATGAETADFLRAVVGPEPVGRLESLSFQARDALNRWLPRNSGSGPAVSWSNQPGATPETLLDSDAMENLATQAVATATLAAADWPSPSETAVPSPTPTPVLDVVTAPPQIGWEAYGPSPMGAPLMARALIMVDPSRSYAGVALVRMDLSQLQLHIMAGFIEPAHPSGIGKLIPNLGVIAPDNQSRLIAAFNGGFKAIHGHYGMMVNRVVLLEPIDGVATVAIYNDGSVRLGPWGSEVPPSMDMIAFRQNCPPLLENGELNPGLASYPDKAWGVTNTADVTWRTGLGLTQDRHYLIYAVGNGTTVQFLAEALQEAGAYNGMQLDVNQYYAHFLTYSPDTSAPADGGLQLVGQQLLQQMINIRKLYLTPHPRDFFYVTLRP